MKRFLAFAHDSMAAAGGMNDCLGLFEISSDAVAAIHAETCAEAGQVLDVHTGRVKWLAKEIATTGYEWLSSDWHPMGELPRDLYAAISEHRMGFIFDMKKANMPQAV